MYIKYSGDSLAQATLNKQPWFQKLELNLRQDYYTIILSQMSQKER